MAWETRKHSGGMYYTRTERRGKRRRRVYFGQGDIADLAATIDQLRQISHELARRETLPHPPKKVPDEEKNG